MSRGSIDAVLGSPPASRLAGRLWSRRLRILAYHDVPDAARFRAQVEHLASQWHPVSGAEVADAVGRGDPLPERSVWVTFDDGRPDVVDAGLPVLEEHGVPATLFVCPSVIESGAPYWWQALEARPSVEAEVHGRRLAGRPLVSALKRVPDAVRRAVVAEVEAQPVEVPAPPQLDRPRLRAWVASGRELGNHTWDHPILDRCTPREQREQVDRAHAWLEEELGEAPTLFAYPNGDRTEVVASQLSRLGYRVAPLFDHRLASTAQDRFALSRIRIDADASLPRARALISGAHTWAFAAGRTVRRSAA